MEGNAVDIKKRLEANPKTKIPQILFTVYQHVFNSIYILASILNTPYPPPDLLHSMAEKIQILPNTPPQTQSQSAGAAVSEQVMKEQTSPQQSQPSVAQPSATGTEEKAKTTATPT
jgi:hypothetical protein